MSLNLDDANEEMYYKKYLKYKEKYIKLVLEKHGGAAIESNLFQLDHISTNPTKYEGPNKDTVIKADQLYVCLYNINMCTAKLVESISMMTKPQTNLKNLQEAMNNCMNILFIANRMLFNLRTESVDIIIKTINDEGEALRYLTQYVGEKNIASFKESYHSRDPFDLLSFNK